jgi:MAP/microtubule affinity-regulating kinase
VRSAAQLQEIDREANTLKMLNHKNIIKLYQGFVVKSELLLIMEYADGGELMDYVEEKKGLEEVEVRSLCK